MFDAIFQTMRKIVTGFFIPDRNFRNMREPIRRFLRSFPFLNLIFQCLFLV